MLLTFKQSFHYNKLSCKFEFVEMNVMNHKKDSDTHDINLNIHYSIPNELWNKVIEVFRSMPYWFEDGKNKDCLFWYDEEDCV